MSVVKEKECYAYEDHEYIKGVERFVFRKDNCSYLFDQSRCYYSNREFHFNDGDGDKVEGVEAKGCMVSQKSRFF